MNNSLAQIILIASNSDGEDTFWMQILVLVVLATLAGLVSLIKTRAKKLKGQESGYVQYVSAAHTRIRRQNKALQKLKNKNVGVFSKAARPKAVIEEHMLDFGGGIAGREKLRNKLAKEEGRDLTAGMEMLELDFLVSVVEKTGREADENDVTMRKLSFNELLRRGKQTRINSDALKIYAMNESNLYGKDIQCEAMKELAERTGL